MEGVARDRDDLGKPLLVDERHAGLRAAVARHEADQHRDHERVHDERRDERGGAPQHPQVLAQEQEDAPHANTSAPGVAS